MPELLGKPPLARADNVAEITHGVTVVDPYRWLEDGNSAETRKWLEQQSSFAREYLDGITGRRRIERRIRTLLRRTTYDSFLIAKQRYVFRKRFAEQEQPCIYVREGSNSPDRLLVDPRTHGTTEYTAVKPVSISPDGKILAYEVKVGGERTSRVKFVNIETGEQLPETLPHGYLRGFSFTPDSQGFYHSVELADQSPHISRVLYRHVLGTHLEDDEIIFDAGSQENTRFGVIDGPVFQLITVRRALDGITDYYLRQPEGNTTIQKVLENVDYIFAPELVNDRIVALTDLNAPNLRIVELRLHPDGTHDFVELVPNRTALIQQWFIVGEHMVVNYLEGTSFRVSIFDLAGNPAGEIPLSEHQTVRLIAANGETNEVLFECESFFQSVSIQRYSITLRERSTLVEAAISLDAKLYGERQISYESKDGTRIPMSLVGLHEVLEQKRNPVILTSYGGFQMAMTPQFSVFVSILMECGCVFALPNIRGGAEFGAAWYAAARRHHRQKAFDDFIAAARWLINNEIAGRNRIAIFGGSNSGLLVGAALTQAPDCFRAVVCIAPLLDMVRYHLFDGAGKWKDEYGTADVPEDFAVLWSYSPYHHVENDIAYPAVMMISGDLDQKCNPLHARKMVARLQAASRSQHPVILDYSTHRGHIPVLPLSVRVSALTDRLAFLYDQLDLGR